MPFLVLRMTAKALHRKRAMIRNPSKAAGWMVD
jgi:hypothetical protein